MADLVNTPTDGDASEVEKPEDSTPERYRGKSPEEIMQMADELRTTVDRMGNELGELRNYRDQTLQQAASVDDKQESVDFFEDPEKAVRRIVDEATADIRKSYLQNSEAVVRGRLDSEYPGWEETVKSNEFQNWVAESKHRVNMFVQANAADWDSANELLGTWQKIQGVEKTAEKAATKAVDRDRKLRAVKTEKGSAGIDPRKILRRADLISLKRDNPDRYNELLPDIKRAYAEGRVR